MSCFIFYGGDIITRAECIRQQRTMFHVNIIFYFKPADRESNNEQNCANRHVIYTAEERVRGSGRL